jgi:TPR repeat protein
MKLFYILFWFTLIVMVSTARADAFEEGMVLYEATEYKKAMEVWRPLAEQGEVAAQVKVGTMHLHGMSVKRDPVEALKWFHKAAKQGNSEAQYNLGNLYGTPHFGIELDQEESVKWYRQAAEHGNADAQYSLGAKYFKGEGLPQDYVMGYAWMEVAARQGHFSAPNYRDLIGMILSADDLEKGNSLADELSKKYGNKG